MFIISILNLFLVVYEVESLGSVEGELAVGGDERQV